MEQNTYGFIGLGLIGGSLAKALKRTDPSCRILAYTRTRATLEEALKAQAVDAACSSVDDPQLHFFMCTGRNEYFRPARSEGYRLS